CFWSESIMRLSIGPGPTALTRMFDGPSSSAAVFTRPYTACLLAMYGAIAGKPMHPAIDDKATIEPPPRALSGATQCFIASHTPVTLVRIVPSNSSTDSASIEEFE